MSMLSIVLLALFAVLANPFVGAQVVPPPAPPSPPPASLNAAITQFAPKLFSVILSNIFQTPADRIFRKFISIELFCFPI